MNALPLDSIKIGSRFRTEHCLMCVRGKPIVELLKRLGEKVSEPQVEFWRWCVRGGVPHSVCRTLNEVLAEFDLWGCLNIIIPSRARKGRAL